MQTLGLTNLSLGSSSVGLSVFVSVAGLTGGFAADGDVLTASVNNPQGGVTYTYRYDFSGGGSSSGAGYTVDFAGDSLSDGDTITVVLLADAVEVATRTFTVYETFTITAAGALADLNLVQNAAMAAVDVSADFTGFVQSIALQSGTLPAGLSFDGTTLSGTPTALQAAGTLVFRASNPGATADTAFQVSVVEVDSTLPVINTFTIGAPVGADFPATLTATEENRAESTIYFGAYLDGATELTNTEVINGTGAGFASVSGATDLVGRSVDLGALAAGSYFVKAVMVDPSGNEGTFTPQALTVAPSAVTGPFDFSAELSGGDTLDQSAFWDAVSVGFSNPIVYDATNDKLVFQTTDGTQGSASYETPSSFSMTGSQFVSATVENSRDDFGSHRISLTLLRQANGDGYRLDIKAPSVALFRTVGGSQSLVGFHNEAWNAGDTFRLEYDDSANTLTVLNNGVQWGTMSYTGATDFGANPSGGLVLEVITGVSPTLYPGMLTEFGYGEV